MLYSACCANYMSERECIILDCRRRKEVCLGSLVTLMARRGKDNHGGVPAVVDTTIDNARRFRCPNKELPGKLGELAGEANLNGAGPKVATQIAAFTADQKQGYPKRPTYFDQQRGRTDPLPR